MRLRPSARLCSLALWCSGVAMIAGSFVTATAAIYRLALGVAVFAATGLMLSRTHVADRQLARARGEGYDDGYRECADTLRMSTLRLVPSSDAAPPLPVPRSASQLEEQVDVGSGADRVG